MSDQLVESIRGFVEGHIDFEGQKLTELLATIVLSVCGAISFIVGFALQDIKLALFIGLGGSAFALAVVVPPWPLYNRHPTKWISDRGIHANTQSIIVDGKTVS